MGRYIKNHNIEFINPYNFIPQANGIKREEPVKTNTYTGYIQCTLTTKTPTIISGDSVEIVGAHKQYKDTVRLGKKGTPAIPGSEIRGMIRHKYETLTNSCMSGLSKELFDKNRGFSACKSTPLCSACTMFGTVNGDFKTQGKVRFSDALLVDDPKDIFIKKSFTLKPLATPHYDNWIFYYDKKDRQNDEEWYKQNWDNNKNVFIRGRKEYWHYEPNLEIRQEQNDTNSTVDVLKTGLNYQFKVFFNDATEQELMRLLYSLSLINGSDYCHKIGKGKPYGFGSVKITTENPVYKDVKFDEGTNAIKYELKEFVPRIDESKKSKKEILKTVFDIQNETQLTAIDHMYSFSFIKDKKGIVSYPKNKENGDKGYEWFAANKTGFKNKVKYQSALPFADEEYDQIIQHGYTRNSEWKSSNRRRNNPKYNKYKNKKRNNRKS